MKFLPQIVAHWDQRVERQPIVWSLVQLDARWKPLVRHPCPKVWHLRRPKGGLHCVEFHPESNVQNERIRHSGPVLADSTILSSSLSQISKHVLQTNGCVYLGWAGHTHRQTVLNTVLDTEKYVPNFMRLIWHYFGVTCTAFCANILYLWFPSGGE